MVFMTYSFVDVKIFATQLRGRGELTSLVVKGPGGMYFHIGRDNQLHKQIKLPTGKMLRLAGKWGVGGGHSTSIQ